MDVSLTDFVIFILKSGTPRLTHVKALINRPPYKPATDYYKTLREAVTQFHQAGSTDWLILEQAADRHVAGREGSKAPARIEAYRRFLGRKSVTWFEPPRTEWIFEELTVRLNPELGLVINGTPNVIKLYWKEERLSKRQIEMILYLMQTELSSHSPEGTQMAILDIPSAKLINSPVPTMDLRPLLRAEARAFIELWRGLE